MFSFLKKNQIFTFILLLVVFILNTIVFSYATDIRMQLLYGINNKAKSGTYLPIEINFQNLEQVDFNGYVVVNVYETNESIYKYKQSININKNSSIKKNMNISLSPRLNTILAVLFDEENKKIQEQRINIDLETLNNSLLIGIMSDNPSTLMYLDDLELKNGNIKTKVVEITNDEYLYNRNILSQIDCLFISDILNTHISDGLNNAIENFIKDGKVVFLGTGKNGGDGIPTIFSKYLYGPTFTKDMLYDFNDFLNNEDDDRNINFMKLNSTIYNFINNVALISNYNNNYVSLLNIGHGIMCNASFSFNDLYDYSTTSNNKFIIKLLENVLGDYRLEKLDNSYNLSNINDYYNVKNLIETIDNTKLPNILFFVICLSIYVVVITLILYTILKWANKKSIYLFFVIFVSIFSCIILYFVFNKIRRNGTFLTYSSIVEIDEDDKKETAFLNFRTFDENGFIFNTSNNNIIYPLLKNTNEPIIINDDDNFKIKKETTFETENNVMYVSVSNPSEFDSSIFMYENKNVNNIYKVDCNINVFDGQVDGRIVNHMDYKLKDVSILMFGKIIYIGDIERNRSVTLKNAKIYNSPINNETMISEIMCFYPKTKLAKYYLQQNELKNNDDVKLVYFLDNVNTIDYNSLKVNNVQGNTMVVKNMQKIKRRDNLVDVSSLKNVVKILNGSYDYNTNTIDGNDEVINEYFFDNNIKIDKIYFENLTDIDMGHLDYNVIFYGNIYIYNYKTHQYEQLLSNNIDANIKNYISNNNSFICKFVPTNRDALYRRISLPHIRGIGKKE